MQPGVQCKNKPHFKQVTRMMKNLTMKAVVIIGLLISQYAFSESNPRFIKLFNYEVQNRIYALQSVSRIAEARSQKQDGAFWKTYQDLENYNQKAYLPIATHYGIDTNTSWLTYIKIHGSRLLASLFPQSAQKSIRDATVAYVNKLEEMERLAPEQHQLFFRYVVEQEKVQAQGLALLTKGKIDEATAVLSDFLKKRHQN